MSSIFSVNVWLTNVGVTPSSQRSPTVCSFTPSTWLNFVHRTQQNQWTHLSTDKVTEPQCFCSCCFPALQQPSGPIPSTVLSIQRKHKPLTGNIISISITTNMLLPLWPITSARLSGLTDCLHNYKTHIGSLSIFSFYSNYPACVFSNYDWKLNQLYKSYKCVSPLTPTLKNTPANSLLF